MMKFIGKGESTTLEWKQSLSEINEIIETVAAFSNTEGGRIIVGVSPQGEVLGVQTGKSTLEKMVNHIAQSTDPKIHPKVTTKNVDGKDLILIDVKESNDHLVLSFGRPFKRVGRSTVRMSKDEYEELIFEKHKNKLFFDETVCKGTTLKDINPNKVFWFLEKAKEEKRLVVPAKLTVKDALIRLNLFRDGKLTNTSILLFGKDPQKFFVQAKIRAARFKGTEGRDFLDMKVLEGTIPDLREKALAFIAEHIKHAVFFDANQRFDKWEYPFRALEEILNNALVHRDYWSNADTHLSIYDDRIEIWNPGELPKPLTPTLLMRKHLSIPRNRFLAERLFYIKYIEHWGQGTNRVVATMREEKLADPIFEELSGGFNVTLIGPGKTFEKTIEDEKLHKLDLNDRQKKAIKYIKDKGSITRHEYILINHVSHTIAHQELKGMLEKRILMTQSAGKYLNYRLTQG